MFERLRAAMNGAINGWRNAGVLPLELSQQQQEYVLNWLLYSGKWFADFDVRNPYRHDPAIYEFTRLFWKHVEAVVDFYAAVIYQGPLSTDGTILPNSAQSAIPIKAQTGDEKRDTNLYKAIGELWVEWNWQEQKSYRPMYGAALGDCLTELVDDRERRFVYPQTIWPGHVKEIELDYVGNVRRYVLEFPVEEKGQDGVLRSYIFTKEVDKESFRYFHDGKPFDHYGTGSVVRNAYGFVPAIWDRHRIGAPGHVRGRSAIDGSRQALMQLNSIFSHAMDFQRKAFIAPIMVAGMGATSSADVDLTKESGADYAETLDLVGVPAEANLLQAQFDIGQTRAMLQDIRDGILAENPEASFYQQMREMQQVTAPGAERLMGDVTNRVDMARARYDTQTIKLLQMAIAMCGMRVQDRTWSNLQSGRLGRRQQAFTMFGLESFDAGDLDMTILPRPIVVPTEQERLETLALKESMMTAVGLEEAWGKDKAGLIIAERQAGEAARREFAMTGMATGALADELYTEGE